MSIKRHGALIILPIVMLLLSACSSLRIPTHSLGDEEQHKADSTVSVFKSNQALAMYFEEAVAYAVFSNTVRAAAGFGGAYGRGWLFEQGKIVGRTQIVEVSAGVNVGAQWYRHIVFFKTEQALKRFQRGSFEFAGQMNLAAGPWGGSTTPAYNEDVALFTVLKGGLLIEASIGTHRFDYAPLAIVPSS